MKKFGRIVAMVLIVALLLTGCTMPDLESILEDAYALITLGTAVAFDEMEYVRPDLDTFRTQLDVCLELAETETDVDDLMAEVYTQYELYYDFYTNYNLADIHYCIDMTDIYWDEEYNFCLENSSEIDAGMDQLLYALADSPLREELESDEFFGEGFFADYEGDSIWDDTFIALSNRENELLSRYYEINAQSVEAEYYSEEFFSEYGLQLEEVFVELVAVRQEIAAYAGYGSYPEFAYDFYYYRDYTPEQTAGYVAQVRDELVDLYLQLDSSVWEVLYETCSQEDTYAYTYECAQAIGGTAENAFKLMEKAGLYDITYSANKYDASFEVFLYSYYVPFVYMCPSQTGLDKLTFTHEFGHFCSDYAAGGSAAGVDVAEVFSQGLEYLSLCYCENTDALARMKMADSLCTFVEQAAYAAFEHQVYELEGEDLTVENVRTLYGQVMDEYGLSEYGRDVRDYVLIPHFYIVPLYVISYVVSNDAALQIYQAELRQTGAGLALWEDNLATMQGYFLAFMEEAGLESPFAEGRVQQIRDTFASVLG